MIAQLDIRVSYLFIILDDYNESLSQLNKIEENKAKIDKADISKPKINNINQEKNASSNYFQNTQVKQEQNIINLPMPDNAFIYDRKEVVADTNFNNNQFTKNINSFQNNTLENKFNSNSNYPPHPKLVSPQFQPEFNNHADDFNSEFNKFEPKAQFTYPTFDDQIFGNPQTNQINPSNFNNFKFDTNKKDNDFDQKGFDNWDDF